MHGRASENLESVVILRDENGNELRMVHGPPVYDIPADYDPEAERRRLQSGGCCGAPSKQ